jgi:hypothetical protein
MIFSSIAALCLLVLSGLLLDAHRRTWLAVEQELSLTERQRRSARAIYLRRMQASGTMGLIGALLMIRPIVPEKLHWFLVYLLVIVLLCGWMLILAVIDAFAASLRARESRHQTESSREKLEEEIRAAEKPSE